MSTERRRYKKCEKDGFTQGPADDILPELDAGTGTFSGLEVVYTAGETYVRKWPEFGITDEAIKIFDQFSAQLPNYPYLHKAFPPTVLRDNHKGRYFLQRMVYPAGSQLSMGIVSKPGVFDESQITSPAIMADLIGVTADGLKLAWDTAAVSAVNGADRAEGLFLEVHNPDNYMLGRLDEGDRNAPHLLDCHPIIPVTWEGFADRRSEIPVDMDILSRQKFGLSLAEFSEAHGLPNLQEIANLPNPESLVEPQDKGGEVIDLSVARVLRRKAQGLKAGAQMTRLAQAAQ